MKVYFVSYWCEELKVCVLCYLEGGDYVWNKDN